MVDRSRSFKLPGPETTDLRIALYKRKEVLERLQEELIAEREASATSATETMAMILRLQVEKSEMAMEADQFKRMAEEHMSHAEMSFEILEDDISQKESHIIALENQVEAYRSQLLSLGFSDFNSLDVKLDENVKMNGLSLSDRSQIPSTELVTDLSIPVEKEIIEESFDSQKKSLDVYWEQIKKLDEQVRKLTDLMRDQYKTSLSETRLNKRENDVASSSNFQEQRKEKTKVSKQTKTEKKSSKQTRDRSNADNQAELQRLRQRVELLERGRTNTESETTGVFKKEEISLRLNVMKEELSSVKSSKVNSLTTMENLQHWVDPAMVSVQEAMLYFWL